MMSLVVYGLGERVRACRQGGFDGLGLRGRVGLMTRVIRGKRVIREERSSLLSGREEEWIVGGS